MTAKITRADEAKWRALLEAAWGPEVAHADPVIRLLDALDAARQMAVALERAHACATVRDDGTCDGCAVSDALAAFAALVDLEDT